MLNIRNIIREEVRLLNENRVDLAVKKWIDSPDKPLYLNKKWGDTILHYLIQLDPSGNNKYLDWMLKTMSDEILGYDGLGDEKWWLKSRMDQLLGKMKEIVESVIFFHNNINRFKNKDINFYLSLDDLLDAIKIVNDKLDTEKLKKEVNIIFKKDGWIILEPLTHEASCKYGAGTKWCTTSKDSPDTFDGYTNGDQKLYYLINNTGVETAEIMLPLHGDRYWEEVDYFTPIAAENLSDFIMESTLNLKSSKNIEDDMINEPIWILDLLGVNLIKDYIKTQKKYLKQKIKYDLMRDWSGEYLIGLNNEELTEDLFIDIEDYAITIDVTKIAIHLDIDCTMTYYDAQDQEFDGDQLGFNIIPKSIKKAIDKLKC